MRITDKRRRLFGACAGVLLTAVFSGAQTKKTAPHPATATAKNAAGTNELELQVLLDRAGFSPGEIDGTPGKNSQEAFAAYMAAHKLGPASARAALRKALGPETAATVSYAITAEDANGPFVESIPKDMEAMAMLPGLYYTSIAEELAEKFHSSPELLKRLNPGATFAAGENIRVPNVMRERETPANPAAAGPVKVIVSKKGWLKVQNSRGTTLFYAPVTSGSEHDPLPIGTWKVTAVQRNPTFYYNPDLFWDANPADAKAKIPPGPNNPVGVVWIDISKPHYGIHGTPEPGHIGYTESHGCVRLTNWDALRLAGMVKEGTTVVFER
jgi:lipoprotein-anchoring transpeptidase ErfK/SrfK